MKNEPVFLSRRDMMKTGFAAMGITMIPERVISLTEDIKERSVVLTDEDRRLSEIFSKYGGEFGGVRPAERRK